MTLSDVQLTGSEEPQVESYRPLCGLAVIAFLFGLASPLAVVTTYLTVIPPAGAALAVAALRRIRASGGELTGRRLANAALALSCFFGAWSVVQYVARPWIISHQARRFCDEWLQLLADDKVLDAYQWTLPPANRVGPTIHLDDFYRLNTESGKTRDDYLVTMPFTTDAHGSSLRSFRFLGNDSVTALETGEDLIVQRYEVVHEKDGQVKTNVLDLTIVRSSPADANFIQWQMRERSFENPDLFKY